MSRRNLLWLAPAAALAVAGCTNDQLAGNNDNGQTIWYTDVAKRPKSPKLSGKDLQGKAVHTPASGVIVVNFWASWCAPCRREGPELVKAAKKTKGRADFFGINIRDDRDKARAFERDLGVDYPSVFDPSGRLSLKFTSVPPNTIPATVLVDPKGRVAAVFRKELTADTLVEAIKDLDAK